MLWIFERQTYEAQLLMAVISVIAHPLRYTGLFEIIVGVLTTCHIQYTWDRSM